MNLKELVRTQSDLLANRRDESESQCKQAYFLIAEAEAQGFNDKAPLKQAMRLFIQAARQRRRYVEPYIGLAYLSLLIDQKEVAQKYLQTALQLEPQNEDALRLQQYLIDGPEETPALEGFALLALEPVTSALDPDQLYDQIEKSLFHWIRELMKLPPPLPCLIAEDLEQLKQQTEELESRVLQVEHQISSLDQEFDTSELRRRLRPMETMLQRYQRALDASEQMLTIQKQIQSLIDTVRGISSRLQRPTPELLVRIETELESLMDSCDWVADQIDAIENQGHDIAPLAYNYNILTTLIEQIRDIVDEHTA
ncbi:MAG: hypothetical protein CVV27_02205 [Candidatus Melainabacteria bacterium HGW-Melainabacteria-1]|nr:MAG: hypothetical protein CVV27_02205 [Candidatus Melainabacteria bacterium HGW-Melainabacteria-1]